MTLTLIAALTWPERVIGAQGKLPFKLSADLKRFKALTLGHPVLMGRKTWDSLPFPLPGRSNVVISRSLPAGPLLHPSGELIMVAPNLDAGLDMAEACPGGQEIFVIGGGEIYALALPRATRLRLTLVHHAFAGDAHFPAIELGAWRETGRERQTSDAGWDYEFIDLTKEPA